MAKCLTAAKASPHNTLTAMCCQMCEIAAGLKVMCVHVLSNLCLSVSRLLSRFVDFQDGNGFSILFWASHKNDHGLVVYLLSRFFNSCISRGIQDMTVDINIRNNDGQSALIQACIHNFDSVAVVLVEAGADIHFTDEVSQKSEFMSDFTSTASQSTTVREGSSVRGGARVGRHSAGGAHVHGRIMVSPSHSHYMAANAVWLFFFFRQRQEFLKLDL